MSFTGCGCTTSFAGCGLMISSSQLSSSGLSKHLPLTPPTTYPPPVTPPTIYPPPVPSKTPPITSGPLMYLLLLSTVIPNVSISFVSLSAFLLSSSFIKTSPVAMLLPSTCSFRTQLVATPSEVPPSFVPVASESLFFCADSSPVPLVMSLLATPPLLMMSLLTLPPLLVSSISSTMTHSLVLVAV